MTAVTLLDLWTAAVFLLLAGGALGVVRLAQWAYSAVRRVWAAWRDPQAHALATVNRWR